MDRHHHQLPVANPPARRRVPTARHRDAGLAGQRTTTGDDHDGRRRPCGLRKASARAGMHGARCVLCRGNGVRVHCQACYSIPRLLCLHRRAGGDADRCQGRNRPRGSGEDSAGQRRFQQCAQPGHSGNSGSQLRVQRHPRYRGQRHTPGLRVGPRGAGARCNRRNCR